MLAARRMMLSASTLVCGPFSDNYNRANSANDTNGGLWQPTGVAGIVPVQGIASNAAYAVNNAGTGDFLYQCLGQAGADITLVPSWTSFSRQVIYFACDVNAGTGYAMEWWQAPMVLLKSSGWPTTTTVGTFSGNAPVSGDTVRLTYNASTGVVTFYVNGVSQGTVTDPSPLSGGSDKMVGVFPTQTYYVGGGTSGTVNTGETWDSLTVTTFP